MNTHPAKANMRHLDAIEDWGQRIRARHMAVEGRHGTAISRVPDVDHLADQMEGLSSSKSQHALPG